jgi:hypothetical protein
MGSGSGTEALSKKYNMISIEHDVKWVGKYDSKYIHAPLTPDYNNPIINWYDTNVIKNELVDKYDLILIDGPPGGASPNKLTRDGFRRNIDLFDITECIIVFDDLHRKEEMDLMMLLVKQINRKYEVFDSGFKSGQRKKFGIIYN